MPDDCCLTTLVSTPNMAEEARPKAEDGLSDDDFDDFCDADDGVAPQPAREPVVSLKRDAAGNIDADSLLQETNKVKTALLGKIWEASGLTAGAVPMDAGSMLAAGKKGVAAPPKLVKDTLGKVQKTLAENVGVGEGEVADIAAVKDDLNASYTARRFRGRGCGGRGCGGRGGARRVRTAVRCGECVDASVRGWRVRARLAGHESNALAADRPARRSSLKTWLRVCASAAGCRP